VEDFLKRQIAIVVPVFNTGQRLLDTFLSIKSQSVEHFIRVILVDDASTDELTVSILRLLASEPNVDVIVRTSNGGICASRNMGLSIAIKTCDYILFLDHDDLLVPDSLQKLASVLDANSTISAVIGISDLIGDNVTAAERSHFLDSQRNRRLIRYSGDGSFQEFSSYDFLTSRHLFSSYTFHPPSKIMHRVNVLARHNIQFKNEYELVEDWVFLHDALSVGCIRLIDDIVTVYRLHTKNSSNSPRSKVKLRKAWWHLFSSKLGNVTRSTDVFMVLLYDLVIRKCAIDYRMFSLHYKSFQCHKLIKCTMQWSIHTMISLCFKLGINLSRLLSSAKQ
jgi:glycosyltransferase involved in cell wall biosynthesis